MAELKQAVNRFDSGIPSQLPATSPIKDPPRLRDSLTTSTRTVPQEVIRKQAMADVDRIRIVSTNDFLDKILPIDSAVVDRIYADVMDVKQKLYNQGGRWNDFPPGGKKKFTEVELYSPFVAIANKIAAHARKQHGESDDQVLAATWVDYHSRAPQSLEPDAVKIRPDCVLAIGGMARTIGDDSDPSMPAEKKDALWWLQLVAAVEAKRDYDQNDRELIVQLLGYLRVMMVEQKDRRFALGLFLSRDQISVWCHDRSGVLGMDVPINIHQDPRSFIHIIAALTVLPAHRLGFDPTMMLAREPSPPIHTYRLSSQGPDQFDIALYKKNSYATQWVIYTEHDVFLTLKALSLLRTDVVVGSGCMVWAVIRYGDRRRDPDERTIFVLKQWWKSESQADEGAIYQELQRIGAASPDPDAQYIGQMHCHETVKINGEVDSTDTLIQRGLNSVPAPPERGAAASRKRSAYSDAEADERLHVTLVTEDDIHVVARYMVGPGATQPQKRTRMRVVLKVFGCSVRFFATLRELIQLLLDGVRGHRFAYKHGFLQRDISLGNLLIALKHDKESPHALAQDIRGCLIDFDHAKCIQPVLERRIPFQEFDAVHLPPSGNQRSSRLQEVNEAVVQRAAHYITLRMQVKNPTDLVDYVLPMKRYIGAAIQYHREHGLALPEGSLYTPEVLGWDTALLTPPLASEDNPKRTPRSGTPPYASAFILNEYRVIPERYGMGTMLQSKFVVHDAIHDMESFFWVLLYLSMTRSGPGGDRRKELSGDLDTLPERDRKDVAEMRRIVWCFFDGTLEVIAWNKKRLIEKSELFEPLVLCHVHPYFDPLKPVLRQWWDLLLLAYEFQGYEYHDIHKFVIALLEKALHDLPADDTTADMEQSAAAMKKRSDFVRRITHAGSASRTSEVQAATPPTSPTQLRITTAFNSRTPEDQKQRSNVAPPLSPTAKKAKHT